MELAAAEQLEDVTGVKVEQPTEGLLLPRHEEPLAVLAFLVVAELNRLTEDPHRQPELVVLGQVDEVRLGDPPALEHLGEREIQLVDVHAPLRFPCLMFTFCSYSLDGRRSIRFYPISSTDGWGNMNEHHTIADRLRARANQLGLSPAHVAEMAGVNRSFVYDILRGRSARPGIDRLAEVARVLKVEREWLIHGIGEVEGEPPFIETPDETFVAIAHASPRPSMGGGAVVTEDHDTPGRAYHFRRSWIKAAAQEPSPALLR